MPENRLGQEKSPYLLQHKDNPVDWYPWSDEAFERARAEDKPVFLSIGYATCHWCHVMERECFEDEDVARLMNQAFVSIKVDREERPDVDQIYMTVCQMATGHGGWPLTVILTPDRRPFYVATYIPKHGRPGRPGMMELIPALSMAWKERRTEVLQSAGSLTEALEKAVEIPPSESEVGIDTLDEAFASLATRFDPHYGGFGSAPKFPSPHNLLFLLRYAARTGSEDALEMASTTLRRMRGGGVFDQVGFGFHRYATDQRWLLPHFEKMLYDQALLLMAYTDAYHLTRDAFFQRTAKEIAQYVSCDMRDYDGGFYSAEDADSEGEEGKYYVWTIDEVRQVLDEEDAAFLIDRFGMTVEGNFEDESTRRRTGSNVLHPERIDTWDERDRRRWNSIRRDLLTHRHDRVRPLLDDKILTDWNGLMITALARAGGVFGESALIEQAATAARFILDRLRRDGRLLHRYRDGDAAIEGHLDDYAFLIWGLLELYEATFDVDWLDHAVELQRVQLELFHDQDGGGFFFTQAEADDLLVRQKEFTDGAIPSGNSASLLNLVRLGRMTAEAHYEEAAAGIIRQAGALLERMPSALTGLLLGIDFWLGPSQEIVIAAGEGEEDMQRVLRERYLPRAVLMRKDAAGDRLSALAPFTAAQEALGGRATVYVCQNYACQAPVTAPEELERVLDSARKEA